MVNALSKQDISAARFTNDTRYERKGAVKDQNSFISNIGLNLGHALASFAS